MIKIAIIAGRDPYISTDTDGGSVFIEYFMKQFEKKDVAVDVYIPSGIRGALYDKNRAKVQHGSRQNSKKVKIIYFNVTTSKSILKKEEDYFAERINRSEEFTDFFSDKKLYSYNLVFILHISNAFGLVNKNLVPLSRTVLFPMMTSANYSLFSKVPKRYTQLEKETLRKIKHICSPSTDEISKIKNNFKVNSRAIFRIHRGFEETDFPAIQRFKISNTDSIKLICANGIRPQKDHLFLVRVAQELRKRKLNFQIHLTGNNGKSHNPLYNAYTRKFWDKIKKNKLESYFIAHDVLNRSNLVELMNSSQIAIYTSISETFGKSALESVATGLPTIVCDDVLAFREFIINNVTGIITSRNPSTCADDILRLILSERLYGKISLNGILLRKKFTWDKVTGDLMKQIEKRKIMDISI